MKEELSDNIDEHVWNRLILSFQPNLNINVNQPMANIALMTKVLVIITEVPTRWLRDRIGW